MKLIVDAFGCDHPEEFIKGSLCALQSDRTLSLVITGKQSEIERVIAKTGADLKRLEIADAPDVIGCEESPTAAIRAKRQSSMVVALERAKADPEIEGMVSAGSTGALLAGGLFKLGRIAGVDRPALAPVFPTRVNGTYAMLIDAGANADCKPAYLAQFALMGTVYMWEMFGVQQPRVALLSNGTEDAKGNELSKESFALCRELDAKGLIRFCGNMEAREILSGDYDVFVTDGFSGNVALKTMEGTANAIFSVMKQEVLGSARSKLGALLMRPALRRVRDRMDYNKIGGAAFLGVEKLLVKAHGASNAAAAEAAVRQVAHMAQAKLTERIRDGLKELGVL